MATETITKEDELKEIMSGSYFYEDRRIGNTRKPKSCDICSSSIPTGSGHAVYKLFNGEFYDFNICSGCEVSYRDELSKIRSGTYDDF